MPKKKWVVTTMNKELSYKPRRFYWTKFGALRYIKYCSKHYPNSILELSEIVFRMVVK